VHLKSATLDTIDGRPVLRFERRLRHAPEKVWKAITDPAEMAHWFPTTVETELRVGARMRFTFPDDEAAIVEDGEILEFDPPKVYAFRWGHDVLRWEIMPEDAGCRLHFSHVLSDAHGGKAAAGRNAAGWDECLAGLSARLDERPAGGPERAMLERIEAYVERFGLGEGGALDHPEGYLVRFERDLVWHPVEHAWAVLTEQATVATGAEPPLPATNGYVPAGPVTEVDPPRVLEYAWLHDGAPAGRVRWELAADPVAGTSVVLTQTVPSNLAHLRATVLAAWQTHLELFFAALFGEVRCPWPAERTERLEQMYAERL
jgi:uncharacterized protein YndB with AHSA1/START domain